MSRSGYTDDCENLELYRANVYRSLKGRRGQEFLRELASTMDAMPEKRLIAEELVTPSGECCALGVICKARGLDVTKVDVEDTERVGKLLGISRIMAAEIVFENDEHTSWRGGEEETSESRWTRMRAQIQEWLS